MPCPIYQKINYSVRARRRQNYFIHREIMDAVPLPIHREKGANFLEAYRMIDIFRVDIQMSTV